MLDILLAGLHLDILTALVGIRLQVLNTIKPKMFHAQNAEGSSRIEAGLLKTNPSPGKGEAMKHTKDRINRFKKAFPEMADKTDVEILYYLKFHKDLKCEIDSTLKRLEQAIQKAEGREER